MTINVVISNKHSQFTLCNVLLKLLLIGPYFDDPRAHGPIILVDRSSFKLFFLT